MGLKYVVYAPGLGKVERTTKLTLSKTADGYTFFHHNNEVMTDGSAVIVIPGVDTQFQMINITERPDDMTLHLPLSHLLHWHAQK
jgi:alkyl sulfatase BDS1-like metallo-beta-lactamase superfamily hydrolase